MQELASLALESRAVSKSVHSQFDRNPKHISAAWEHQIRAAQAEYSRALVTIDETIDRAADIVEMASEIERRAKKRLIEVRVFTSASNKNAENVIARANIAAVEILQVALELSESRAPHKGRESDATQRRILESAAQVVTEIISGIESKFVDIGVSQEQFIDDSTFGLRDAA